MPYYSAGNYSKSSPQRIHLDRENQIRTHFTYIHIYAITSKKSPQEPRSHDALSTKTQLFTVAHESIRRLVLPLFISILSFSYSQDNGGRFQNH
jgi:hypothetical protein